MCLCLVLLNALYSTLGFSEGSRNVLYKKRNWTKLNMDPLVFCDSEGRQIWIYFRIYLDAVEIMRYEVIIIR